ncbi:plasmid partitioning protein RepB C-terminal domain-containing protein [Sphingobium agri]|uniref:RepB plasmid partition n=1 Tax=Sphingobium agri TaxID=2933566 RepID=A0ABT0DU67_9SPHN|nr:plasmid partitioning protein RepB C-terminal domain-containing protein [Sphingobium agri]MCK0530661.1 RepB plasmid partition [Sphingobium agri]
MTESRRVRLAFETTSRLVALDRLIPLKMLRDGWRESAKYRQILGSVRAIGLVEAPVVTSAPTAPGCYYLLDGHLRIEALRDIGAEEVECLVSTDDEGYTYNRRINRLTPVQEHRMIRRAVERGVPETQIGKALGLDVGSIHRRTRLLNGISADAVDLLKDIQCPAIVFDLLRQMLPARQVEAAELMIGQNNFSGQFARALLGATPDRLLVKSRKRAADAGSSADQLARMEHELARLQLQVKSVEDTYGVDNLHLTVARGYVRSLLSNPRIVRWVDQHRPEYLRELQVIAEIEVIAATADAAE